MEIPRLILPSWREDLRRRPMIEFISLTIGYEEVYDDQPTWQKAIDLLTSYSLKQVAEVLSRTSALLHGNDGLELKTQQLICQSIFDDASGYVWLRVHN